MTRKLLEPLGMFVALFLLQGAAFAHHGTSAYSTQVITMKGTVTSFEFMNPHTEVRVDVTDASGHRVSWMCEAGSLNFLVRRGWTKSSMKPGDVITVMGNPLKTGAPNLRLTKVVLPDGKELNPLTGDQNVE
jgi:uncharacterized protein DUF6152